MMTIDFIFNKYGSFLFILLTLVLCRNCANKYDEGANEVAVKNYEIMVKEQKTTEATLSGNYTEKTLKVLGIPAKFYDFNYTFFLDGKVYDGVAENLTEKPKTSTIKIYYSSLDPTYNSFNPKEKLSTENDKKSNSNLYLSIFFGILSLVLIRQLFIEYKAAKREYYDN